MLRLREIWGLGIGCGLEVVGRVDTSVESSG